MGWRVGLTGWQTFQKKLISVTAAPQMIAAPHEPRTPTLPRPARCELDGFAPNPHTIAKMISASTDKIRPIVIIAPTMLRSCAIPGSPSSFGVMSTSVGRDDGFGGTQLIRSNAASSSQTEGQRDLPAGT